MHTLEQLRSGNLTGARTLALREGLSEFPREIFALADTLEVLDLSGNALTTLPDDLPRLHKLRVLFASNNPFTELPAVLGQCLGLRMIGFKANRIATVPPQSLPPRLRWLVLTDNAIDHLPDSIGDCRDLQKLMLAGNRLNTLPDTLAACQNLELLRIAANELSALPDWLPDMPRLAWLAFAGNPFSLETPETSATPNAADTIAWNTLTLDGILGEGASGVIHAGSHSDHGALAIKLFKGAVTSDGLPHSEMAACLHAGRHPHLIPVLGRVTGHPDDRLALAMERIPAGFTPLAGPPSLDTCTRDVYAADTHFTAEAALNIATGIASAARHLHARGILHGDLYAHNILHDGNGRAVIGDFGAASIMPASLAQPLEHIEVRAFGCLLEELAARCAPSPAASTLARLATACLDPIPAHRPSFADLTAELA